MKINGSKNVPQLTYLSGTWQCQPVFLFLFFMVYFITLIIWDYIALNDWMIGEWWIGKDVTGTCHAICQSAILAFTANCWVLSRKTCKSWGFCSSVAEDSVLQEYWAMSAKWVPTFRGNLCHLQGPSHKDETMLPWNFQIWSPTYMTSYPKRTESSRKAYHWSWCPSWDSNEEPLRCMSRSLTAWVSLQRDNFFHCKCEVL